VATTANLDQFDVGLRPGTSAAGYIAAVNARLARPARGGHRPGRRPVLPDRQRADRMLALMVAVAAGLGVLNTC